MAPSCKLELPRFSAQLKIQDEARMWQQILLKFKKKENILRWRTTMDGRLTWIEDDWWPWMEDNLSWKTSLVGRQPLMEKNLGLKMTLDERWPNVRGQFFFLCLGIYGTRRRAGAWPPEGVPQEKLRDVLQEREGTSLNYFFNYIERYSWSILVYLAQSWSILDYLGLSWCISVYLGLTRSNSV